MLLIGTPLPDTMRFAFTTQRKLFAKTEEQRLRSLFFFLSLFLKICDARCVDNMRDYATMKTWRAICSRVFFRFLIGNKEKWINIKELIFSKIFVERR